MLVYSAGLVDVWLPSPHVKSLMNAVTSTISYMGAEILAIWKEHKEGCRLHNFIVLAAVSDILSRWDHMQMLSACPFMLWDLES